jgi:hypothetical protein
MVADLTLEELDRGATWRMKDGSLLILETEGILGTDEDLGPVSWVPVIFDDEAYTFLTMDEVKEMVGADALTAQRERILSEVAEKGKVLL